MSRNYKFRDNRMPHFCTATVVDWVDIFTRPLYKDVIVESLRYCIKHKDLKLFAWCLMTNHLHMIIGSRGTHQSIIMRDFKRHTSTTLKSILKRNLKESRASWMLPKFEWMGIHTAANKDWKLWQSENHPIELNSNQKIRQRFNYLHNNPVKAGFVAKPEHWLYSSATNYAGLPSLIPEVEVVDYE